MLHERTSTRGTNPTEHWSSGLLFEQILLSVEDPEICITGV